MNMTREEATIRIKDHMVAHHMGRYPHIKIKEALDLALTALRSPTREMVERMRGEWMFPIFADQQDANDPRCQCSECGSIETPLARHRFCPACGAPMTDEAVDMMLERWKEAVDDDNLHLS